MDRSALLKSAIFAITAGILLAAMPVAEASAKVTIKEKTTYYSVIGKDGAQLSRSMVRGGLWRIRQMHAIAATQTDLDFGRPEIIIKNGKCVLKDPSVTLKIKYIYPKWPGYKRASPALKKRWDSFYKELVKHEQQHARIARTGAKELDRALRSVSTDASRGCNDFAPMITRRLETIIQKTAQKQLNFDEREYGASSRVSKAQQLLYKTK